MEILTSVRDRTQKESSLKNIFLRASVFNGVLHVVFVMYVQTDVQRFHHVVFLVHQLINGRFNIAVL